MTTTTTTSAAAPAKYEPKLIEERWVDAWRDARVGAGDALSEGPRFSMVMPPPNVTGALHLGHTMMAAIQDTVVRYKKMTGHDICWVPGIDHAGIATQSVVERHLAAEGSPSRHEIGREKFLDRVWAWKEEKGGRIMYQLRRLGCVCDWEREAFTMNSTLSEAVVAAFVGLHEKGLVYRDLRLVSWSCHLKTAISDIEVDTLDLEKPDRIRVPGYDRTVEVGMLWQFKYPLKRSVKVLDAPGASGMPKIECSEWIEVATTRPETMFGDVAVAVNPNDSRYAHMVGQELYHPFAPERKMLVVADDHCDPEFGTGAVKVTPAHDRNDYEIGLRHNLTPITIFTLDGKINEHGGPHFNGMHRFEARVEVEKCLTEMGLFVEKIKNSKKMSVPLCSRSGDIVEAMLVPQWYVRCDKMAARAKAACSDGQLTILPAGSEKQWYYWLDNIRDWCVSRQLWWGHRIPAYRITHVAVGDAEEWVVSRDEASAREKALELLKSKYEQSAEAAAAGLELTQDPDVLDTWFSSGLFPFSVFGWPNTSSDALKRYFPTDLLETGSDILFFWVARMVMLSLELLDQVPFKTIYLHPMVRDSHGKKMSKSTGNVVDPVDVINGISLEALSATIRASNLKESERKRALDAQAKDFPEGIEECGTDALRYGLLAYLKGGRSVNLDIKRVVAYRHFCNKIYNAMKFMLTYLKPLKGRLGASTPLSTHWADRWIRHKLNGCVAATRTALETLEFYDAVNATYGFFLYDFCDVYLEISKTRLGAEASEADALACAQTLFYTFATILKAMHPLMPFISEECATILHEECGVVRESPFLIDCAFPAADTAVEDAQVVAEVASAMDVVHILRSMLSQFEVPPKERLHSFVHTARSPVFADKLSAIAALAKVGSVSLASEVAPAWVCESTLEGDVVALDPAGLIDFEKVVAKLSKKEAQVTKTLAGLRAKTSVAGYAEKVPADVREKTAESLATYESELARLEAALASARAHARAE